MKSLLRGTPFHGRFGIAIEIILIDIQIERAQVCNAELVDQSINAVIFKALISDHYKLPVDDLAVEKTVRLDKKKSDLVDSVELAKKELKAIHEDSRTQKQRDRLRKQYDKKAKKKRAKEEKQLAKQAKKSIEKVEPVLKQTTSRKPQVARKLRTEKPISGIPEAMPAKKHAVDARRTPIDDLFDKLSSEKVN